MLDAFQIIYTQLILYDKPMWERETIAIKLLYEYLVIDEVNVKLMCVTQCTHSGDIYLLDSPRLLISQSHLRSQ